MERKYAGERFKSQAARIRQLAADSGIGRSQIYRVLDKTQGTSIDNLEWLAEVFGVRPHELLIPYFARGGAVTALPTKRRKP